MTRRTSTSPHRVRDLLQELPELAPPDEVWAEIERRTRPDQRLRGPDRRWLAAAAGTVLAITAGVWMLGRSHSTLPLSDIPALVAQSQQLERRVTRHETHSDASRWDTSRRALVYRIADLDQELAPLSSDPGRDPVRAEALWRQRVALMQSLAELDRTDAIHRTLAL